MNKHTDNSWEGLLSQAYDLNHDKGTSELRRHANVSIENRHYCQSCFTCACLTVLDRLTPGGYSKYIRGF